MGQSSGVLLKGVATIWRCPLHEGLTVALSFYLYSVHAHVHVWLYIQSMHMYMCGSVFSPCTCTCVALYLVHAHVHVWLSIGIILCIVLPFDMRQNKKLYYRINAVHLLFRFEVYRELTPIASSIRKSFIHVSIPSIIESASFPVTESACVSMCKTHIHVIPVASILTITLLQQRFQKLMLL